MTTASGHEFLVFASAHYLTILDYLQQDMGERLADNVAFAPENVFGTFKITQAWVRVTYPKIQG